MNDDVRTLFNEVADLAPDQREAYYSQRQVPARVRAEIESLLVFDKAGEDSLGGVVGAVAAKLVRSGTPIPADRQCWPYRLVRLLGNGRMGSVSLAERTDRELDQQVTLKFLRDGAPLPLFRERFLRERKSLTSLNHPRIAYLLNAGHTGGHRYFVMLNVDGTRIDPYAAGLDLRGVLALFLKVAEAVSYDGTDLIIHRDLNPFDILIDLAIQAQLLDFGIPKILGPEETRTVQRMLTPDYTSPEQLRGDAQAPTTGIYSLGAILSRLLTCRSVNATDNPPRRGLPGDLQVILTKAMRQEPEER